MIRAKIDILEALKAKGYTTTRLRNDGVLGEAILTKIRRGDLTGVSLKTINTICGILKKQPGQLLEFVEDQETK